MVSNASPSIMGVGSYDNHIQRMMNTDRNVAQSSNMPSSHYTLTGHNIMRSASNRTGLHAAMNALSNPILTMTNGLETIKEEKKGKKA